MRQASIKDAMRLVALMKEFYAECGTPFDPTAATLAFEALLSDERLGKVWLIQAGDDDVGYAVVTYSYSMEFSGRNAFLDDLFIQSAFRGAGLGTAAVAEVRAFCMERDVRALHLEAGRDNVAAQALYRRAGFVATDRQLLTLVLPR